MSNTRQPGYYRVKQDMNWGIYFFNGDNWFLPGIERCPNPKFFDEIDPTPINPEPQQSIPAHVLSEFMPAIQERIRQIEKEGWSQAHDDTHGSGEIAQAAACYSMPDNKRQKMNIGMPWDWPWSLSWWKPSPGNRKRELEKAMALLAAEYGRLSRIEQCAADQEAGKV